MEQRSRLSLQLLHRMFFGVAGTHREHLRRQRYFLLLVLAFPSMLFFGLLDLLRGDILLGVVVIGTNLPLWLGAWHLLRRGNESLVFNLGTICYGLFLLGLSYHGGNEGSMLVWNYTFPMIAVLLNGNRRGGLYCLLHVLLLVILFRSPQLPGIHSYGGDLELRFLFSLGAIMVMTILFEHLRLRVEQELDEQHRLLSEEVQLRRQTEAQKEQLITELRAALDEVKTLSGFLPLCAHCHKIRDDQGYWNRLEAYLAQHADLRFSHGLCPDCAERTMKEFEQGAPGAPRS